MRVFVVGTGRCGFVTCFQACRHLTNFTTALGSKANLPANLTLRLEFPDDHVEFDAQLIWTLPLLLAKYPEARFVHLQRDRTSTIASWLRGPRPAGCDARELVDALFHSPRHGQASTTAKSNGFALLYDALVATIESHLDATEHRRHIWIDRLPEDLPAFWRWIGGAGDLDAAVATSRKKFNAAT